MSKKILILVLSADFHPYSEMIETSMNTWDSEHVEGVETIFYCGESLKQNTDKVIYIPVKEHLLNLGHKCLGAFDWTLKNKEFDYVARVHSSIYVDKKKLKEYCDNLPTTDLFMGAEADSANGFKYQWGGVGFIFSKDVVRKIVDFKYLWRHNYMEDESLGLITRELHVPYTPLYSSGIDKMENDWRIITYNGEGAFSFNSFDEVKKLNHHFYRVKHDKDRSVDKYVMNELFKMSQHD